MDSAVRRPRRSESLVGRRFTRLLVLEEVQHDGRAHGRVYLCLCDCGNQSRVIAGKLTSGHTKSCGCWSRDRATTHGCAGDGTPTRAYVAWHGMVQRCRNPNHASWDRYGGRGIVICDRWKDSFENFLADMGEPGDGLTLDRMDNDGPYSPDNCRWASRKEQVNNRRCNVRITLNGRTQTLMQWCEELGLKFNTILCRLRRGWSGEKALTEPIGEWHGRR